MLTKLTLEESLKAKLLHPDCVETGKKTQRIRTGTLVPASAEGDYQKNSDQKTGKLFHDLTSVSNVGKSYHITEAKSNKKEEYAIQGEQSAGIRAGGFCPRAGHQEAASLHGQITNGVPGAHCQPCIEFTASM